MKPPTVWIEQLSALTLEQGIDDLVVGPSGDLDHQLRRFAEEVTPVVQEVIANERALSGSVAKLSIS